MSERDDAAVPGVAVPGVAVPSAAVPAAAALRPNQPPAQQPVPPAGQSPGPVNDEVLRLARAHAPDLYLSALLAPGAHQPDLITLAAFFGDVDRIVLTVSDPTLAEIRLQWWRDALTSARAGQRSGSPVADAVGGVMIRRDLPLSTFEHVLDARVLDLYADPLPDEDALSHYVAHTDGAAFALAARCLGATAPGPGSLIAAAAEAYGRARLIARSAVLLTRGRSPFPGSMPADDADLAAVLATRRAETRDRLSTARGKWRTAAWQERAACLPLGLVEPYLRAAEGAAHDPRRTIAELSPLQRVWRVWRARRLGIV